MTPTGPLEDDIAELLEGQLAANADHWYHTRDSRRSREGYPDYTIVVGPWLLFAELKRAGGSPTAAQAAWLLALRGSMRLALLVGGVEGAVQLGELVKRIRNGAVAPESLGAVGWRVQVLGDISPAGRLAVADDGAGGLRGVSYAAAVAPTPPRRCRRGIRTRPRGS